MKFIKFNISIFLLVMILFFIPSLLSAAEEKLEKIYPFERDGKMYLENVYGDIMVKSWEKNEIKILASKFADEKESLDDVTVDIKQTGGNIRIITRYSNSDAFSQPESLMVSYEIFIPAEAQIKVKSISGTVKTMDIGGFVDIETVNGMADIITAKSGVKCITIGGDINLEGIIGDTVLKSTSGKIRGNVVKGSVEADTVGGDIEITGLSSADEIQLESVRGNIDIQGELIPGGIYSFNTISGRIRLTLPSTSDFELQMNAANGIIKCDFELDDYNLISRHKLYGTMGNGDSSLKLSSFSGDILIYKSNK